MNDKTKRAATGAAAALLAVNINGYLTYSVADADLNGPRVHGYVQVPCEQAAANGHADYPDGGLDRSDEGTCLVDPDTAREFYLIEGPRGG